MGRPPKHDDREVLSLFTEADAPCLFTTEVAELLNMTQQGAFERLSNLEEKGYAAGKTHKNARVWWLTPEGANYISN
jgi:Mn-dependent DtxR family transcriptional regulator